jgi:CRP-like cAMP-binding protein
LSVVDPELQKARILDEDRGLAAAVGEDLSIARQYAVVDVIELPRGTHRPLEPTQRGHLLGLLVLDGLLIRQVAVAERRCGELVAAGAVLRPWDNFGRDAPLPFEVSWRVLQPARLALLDRRFLATIVRWPNLIEAVVERVNERAHALAFNVAIHSLQHVEIRLIVLFWHLADRFGRVTPIGTVVPLPLSHSDLAELVGAARPSVSSALKYLEQRGLVMRNLEDRSWILSRDPPQQLKDMRRHGVKR